MSSPGASSTPVLNVAGYLFVSIDDPQALREALRRQLDAPAVDGERTETSQHPLRGTILVSPEGINLFLAGAPGMVRAFLEQLRARPGFAALAVKESWSETVPFGRLEIKVKREIIRMDRPSVRPGDERAPAIDPATLRRWLDAGRDDNGREVVMLDTRNAFEVDYGRFEGAIDWRIERFTQFPEAVREHRDDLAGKTVVSYCTGGIRCEKAAIELRDAGIDAWQLDGGILGYFEHVGGAHFAGDCFVFDEREALTPALAPVGRA
ncbi:sulfurtransferase [uncultured Microbacterium sp.]|uniref:sulfurtransferase n=1 Tax=uncultured Microbacterium sp. TaxID=191216 RepID=UPI0025EBD22C|nr:sulfurtransferase [uncultured Microbacterium sp.]